MFERMSSIMTYLVSNNAPTYAYIFETNQVVALTMERIIMVMTLRCHQMCQVQSNVKKLVKITQDADFLHIQLLV